MQKFFVSKLSKFHGFFKRRKIEITLADIWKRFDILESRFNSVDHSLNDIWEKLSDHSRRNSIEMAGLNFELRDVLEAFLLQQKINSLDWILKAERQVAADTNDHLFPRGTKNDNTRHPRFVNACEALFVAPIRHLDLGCAGGGLVWDFTRRGHLSVGLEGSDYNLREQRAEWRTIPDRLFTADICYPFHFIDSQRKKISFDVISAWELFEHIPEKHLQSLLNNVVDNLKTGGYLVASIATFLDRDEKTGVIYHHTVKPREWWEIKFRQFGLIPVSGVFETGDFARGVGNTSAYDWDVRANPEMGFHIALRYDPSSAAEDRH